MKQYMEKRLCELEAFHNYAQQHDIKYTIACGTAIGYLSIRSYFAWDDDIDIHYDKKECFDKICDLYNSGEPIGYLWKDKNWYFRKTIINDISFYIVRYVGKIKALSCAFKLILDDGNDVKHQPDLGGLDIFGEVTVYKGSPTLTFKIPPQPITFCCVNTMLSMDKEHIDILIKSYGQPNTWGYHLNDDEKVEREKNIKFIDNYSIQP
tara:strand:+ start:1131 stop:1754 length:624 start_codon:yes stop_codon:yes gene_type:complete